MIKIKKRDELKYVGQRTSIRYYVYTILACSFFIFIKSATICKIKQVIIFKNNIDINNNRRPNNNTSYNIYDNKTDDGVKLKKNHF